MGWPVSSNFVWRTTLYAIWRAGTPEEGLVRQRNLYQFTEPCAIVLYPSEHPVRGQAPDE